MKVEVDKLDFNKFDNGPTGSKNKKIDDLEISNFKTITVVLEKKQQKKTVYNKLNKKVNHLKNKIHDASNLIQTNQYNGGKQNLGKNMVV